MLQFATTTTKNLCTLVNWYNYFADQLRFVKRVAKYKRQQRDGMTKADFLYESKQKVKYKNSFSLCKQANKQLEICEIFPWLYRKRH